MNRELRSKRTASPGIALEPQRRKIRKGTQSCWECKRRKVRCILSIATASVCDGCQRRKTACIGQGFPDTPAVIDGDVQLHDRLNRLEATASRLSEKIDTIMDKARGNCDATMLSPPESSLYNMLLKAWPSQHDLEIILRLPADIIGLCHGTICAPFSAVISQELLSVPQVLQLPPDGSHPLLVARRLLVLATYLQNLSPTCRRTPEALSIDHHAIMVLAVQMVHKTVVSNDELLASIEGIECAMMGAMYHNNDGNLLRAWQLIHRAMPIAQMMGLDKATPPKNLKFIDDETRKRVDPECMWFRLTQMNRYLSSMLGLLQGTPDNGFADHEKLGTCSPVERMQRLDCAAGGLILQRNESNLYDPRTTHMIDQLLQSSEACLSPLWWAVPNPKSNTNHDIKALENVIRVMDQLTHYHLITQLHLPHALRTDHDTESDYSRMRAVNASREVLLRFTALHREHSFASFCRGINFLAFISCVTLVSVHNYARSQHQSHVHAGFNKQLAMQYQKDRRMMELTLESMHHMACVSKDKIASKLTIALRALLAVDVVAGKYIRNTPRNDIERGLVCGGELSECGQILQIHIPCMGNIQFERGDWSTSIPRGLSLPMDVHLMAIPQMSTPQFSTVVISSPRALLDEPEQQSSYTSHMALGAQSSEPSADDDRSCLSPLLGEIFSDMIQPDLIDA